MSFKINLLLIGGVCISLQLFSQKRLELNFNGKYVLENTDYFSTTELKYKVKKNGEVFYAIDEGNKLSIYRKKFYSDASELFHSISLNKVKNQFFTSFDVDVDKGFIYYLFNDKILKFHLLDNEKASEFNIPEQDDYQAKVNIPNVCYDLYLEDETIVLTSGYNHYVEENEEAKCLYFIIQRDSMNEVFSAEFEHDAIGFSHLPFYFSDVFNNRIVFTNALINEAVVIDLNNSNSIQTLGYSNFLNEGVKEIPFNTRISSNINAKEVVYNISSFAKKVDRIEGVSFVNDSTLMLVEKKKGKSIRGKRILHFYIFDSQQQKWRFFVKRKFKNRSISRKGGILQFYYPSGFDIIDGKMYVVEFNIPNHITNKKNLERFMIDNPEDNFAIYEFKISL